MNRTNEDNNLSSRTPTPHERHDKSPAIELARLRGRPSTRSLSAREDATAVDSSGGASDPKRNDLNEDSIIEVDWEGPEDPENPKNWSFKKKWAVTAIMSGFNFISAVSSSMVAPAADQVAQQFGITSTVITAMTISVYLLAYAVAPLFLGPMSEIYGRSRVLQLANAFYLVWNIACGFAQTTNQLIVFRFLSGLGGSAPLAIGGGVLGDCWRAHERGQAIALYSLAPLLGPVIGPIAGGWIAETTTWRWVFWSSSIADAIVLVLGLSMQETFAPLLLERKANKIRKQMELKPEDHDRVRTSFYTQDRHWKSLLAKAIVRPWALFVREPIIQLLGLYMTFVYGLLYLLLTTIPLIFQGIYQENVVVGGLNYIALGIGLTVGSQANARLLDFSYRYFLHKNGGVGRPEFRLPSMVPGTILMPIGLLLTGWSAQEHVHWIVPDIGIVLVGAGMILNFQSIQTYVIDAFTLHAASAMAAVSCLRSIAGFGFPLFAPAMYNSLGFGKGNTVLAAVAIAIGCPAPWLFWQYGERIRNRSKFAAST